MHSRKPRPWLPFIPLLGCLLAPVPSMAQAGNQLPLVGKADAKPRTVVWRYGSQGQKFDPERTATLSVEFGDTQWAITEKGLAITREQKPLVTIGGYLQNSDQTFFQFSGLGQNLILNATVERDPQTGKGLGQLYLTFLHTDGTFSVYFVRSALTFTQPNTSVGTGGDGFGGQ